MILINGEVHITMKEAADRKGISYGTLLSAVNRNKINSTYDAAYPRRRLLKPEDVDAYQVSSHGGRRAGAGRRSRRYPNHD